MISGLSIDLRTFSRKLCSGRFPLPRSEGLLAPIFQVHNTTLISRNEQYSVSRFCISFSTISTPTQREEFTKPIIHKQSIPDFHCPIFSHGNHHSNSRTPKTRLISHQMANLHLVMCIPIFTHPPRYNTRIVNIYHPRPEPRP